MILSIIVAVAENNAIGAGNDLLWHLPDDLKRFATTTTGHTIIMGRNTFLSLPKGALPNRRNIVVSTQETHLPGAEVYPSVEEAISAVQNDGEVFIIGGAKLYSSTLKRAHKLYFTRVHHSFEEADTFFPPVAWDEWQEVEKKEFEKDERNRFATTLHIYQRIALSNE